MAGGKALSNKPLLLNLEPKDYSESAKTLLQTYFEYKDWDGGSIENIPDNVHTLIVRLQNYIGKNILDKLPQIKFIVSATTGLDHIDLQEAKRRDIEIVSLRGELDFLNSISSTPELAWGLLIALIRNIPAAIQSVDNGNWERDLFKGQQLKGKTLGIIGLGRTGRMMANYGQCFGMHVKYFDPYIRSTQYENAGSIEELVSNVDIISLHVHLSEETKYLINSRILGYVKKGTYIINTSRGDICDEEAVVSALKAGVLAGVGTDVLSTELDDFTKSKLYLARKQGLNILITPHIGGASYDAMAETEKFVAEKVVQLAFNREH